MVIFLIHDSGMLKAEPRLFSAVSALNELLGVLAPEGVKKFLKRVNNPTRPDLGHICWEKLESSREDGERRECRAFLKGDGLRRLETCCLPS
jgi:hypothetical protein